jgi:hypothetical protein
MENQQKREGSKEIKLENVVPQIDADLQDRSNVLRVRREQAATNSAAVFRSNQ